MNIDYAKIIELADKRREVLMALSEKLNKAAAFHGMLEGVLEWVGEIYSLYSKLDDEGRKLLPPSVLTAMQYLGTTHTKLSDAIDNRKCNPAGAAFGVKYFTQPEVEV